MWGYCTLYLINNSQWSRGALPIDRSPLEHGPGFIDGLEKMDRYSYRLYRSFNNFKSRQLLVFLFGSLYHNFFLWLLTMCILNSSSHFLIVKTLQVAEVSVIQLFSYLQLVFCSITGVIIFQKI